MATEDTHRLGYSRVDDDSDVDVLIATMDGTAGWDATLRLRSWERAHLGLLTVSYCSTGLRPRGGSARAGPGSRGGVRFGVDASERMLRVARSRPGPRLVACASPSVMRASSMSPTSPSTPRGRTHAPVALRPRGLRSRRWCGSCDHGPRLADRHRLVNVHPRCRDDALSPGPRRVANGRNRASNVGGDCTTSSARRLRPARENGGDADLDELGP